MIWTKLQNIAIIRTDRLGDMVLTLPMTRAIKECLPNSKVTIIASSYIEPLLYNNPFVDNYFFVDKIPLEAIFYENKFEIAFFPRPRFNEALAAYKYKIPVRIGSAYRWYSFLFNRKLKIHRKKGNLHEAEYNTMMVESYFNRKLATELIKPYLKPEAESNVLFLLQRMNINNEKKKVIIHPGSRGSAKDWSAENFGRTAKRLKESIDCEIIITGTNQEKLNCEIVQKECPSAHNLCGILVLDELIALLSKANLLIANSTGVLHLASALGIAVLGLYPKTKHIGAGRWGPYTKNAIVITPPETIKNIDDMSSIDVEVVVQSALKLL